jgi:hypothetical protein
MIAPILSSILFNSIYKATLHIWSGFAFAVCAAMQAVVLVLMMYELNYSKQNNAFFQNCAYPNGTNMARGER